MPIETITNSWIGCGTPSTPDDLLRSVAAQYRDIARLKPTRAGGVQSRQAGFPDTPGSLGVGVPNGPFG